jgi:hypothetical protein
MIVCLSAVVGGPPCRPVNLGRRFSLNARTPPSPSSVATVVLGAAIQSTTRFYLASRSDSCWPSTLAVIQAEHARAVTSQIGRVVEDEGPIHRHVLTERLKEINGIARVGPNVQANIEQALALARGARVVDRDLRSTTFSWRVDARIVSRYHWRPSAAATFRTCDVGR